MKASPEKPIHTVSVRDLVEFILRRGDLGGEREFVGSDRALAGIRGHQKIQRSRPTGYLTELPVEHRVEVDEFTLQIRGRIDGLLITSERVLLEEIKTVSGTWDHEANPLHWAQAKLYGFMHVRENPLKELVIQLVYLKLPAGKVTEFRQTFSFAELSDFFTTTTALYVAWLRERHHWCLVRDASIAALAFPFPEYRPGQRELAVAAYRVLASGGRVFLAAPTGIGKTISTLFPAVKALGEGKLERIFYLTARTVGRAIAEKALVDLRRAGLKLRAVTLTAKEKVCVREGHPCDPLTCPFARCYYDRVKPAIREALEQEELSRSVLETVGQKHQVCPFELSLDVSVWADAIICDYNYVFDPQVYLRRHFAEDGGAYCFLVDEAHNLVDRARDMFSADIEGREILDVQRAIKKGAPRCSKALAQLHAAMRKLDNATESVEERIEASDPCSELNLFPVKTATIREQDDGVSTSLEFPESLIEPLETALNEAERWLVKNQPAEFREALLALYFRLHSFRRTVEDYDERFVTIIESDPSIMVRLFCLDPSLLLRKALARGKAAIFFSATLTPMDYYRTLLGGVPEDSVLQLASPFPPENLAVLIHDRIQTHFKGRAESLGNVVEAIGTLVSGRPGNYLVYFPSYQYLNAVLQEFQVCHPTFPVLVQRPGMTEPERDAFLTKLGDLGVRRVTVSTPFLLELVKRRFPEFKVRVGIYAQVDTPRRARFWEDLGADAIVLESFSINRNFRRLAAIRQAVRCDLELIANHVCLMNCPMQTYHQNGFAHASDDTSTLFIDYCFLRCSRLRLTDPSQFIKAAWIRPEDLASYEAMGYTTFKLLERGIPSAELLRRVKAYSERRFDGNLAGLLLSYGFKEPVRKESLWTLRHFWKPRQVNPLRLKPLTELARLQGMLSPLPESPIRVEARHIPDSFLDGFRDRDCASMDCQACGYCERIAAQAVSISPEYRSEVLRKYAELDDTMVAGGLWGV